MVDQDLAASLPHDRLGLILVHMGKFAQAEQSLQEVIKREPKFFDYLHAFAILHLENGQR
jgi:hypothetical protein